MLQVAQINYRVNQHTASAWELQAAGDAAVPILGGCRALPTPRCPLSAMARTAATGQWAQSEQLQQVLSVTPWLAFSVGRSKRYKRKKFF